MKKPTIVPFVKWVGGKRQLLKNIEERLPKQFNTYHEPFVGGGALFFHLQPEKACISDLNQELVNTYKVIKGKSSRNRLREYLLLMEYGHRVEEKIIEKEGKEVIKKNSPFYDVVRKIDHYKEFEGRKLNMNDSKELLAARFIYLNKNNFNGLYRVNSSGLYNVPSKHHNKSPNTFDWNNLTLAGESLKNTQIKRQKFQNVIKQASKGDFVYFDPPYDYEAGVNGFVSYQKEGFGQNGQVDLAKTCKKLDKMGVMFMVSNHNTTLIKELYKEFNIDVIKAKRMVGGKGASRDDVEEVLITNYGINR